MKPINLGNDISTVQWENENEFRAYPFDSATCGADFPLGVVADMSIVHSDGSSEFRLTSLHVGPGMVSVSVSNGSALLVCTVGRSAFEPYRPYRMTAVGGDATIAVAGMCSFGDVSFDEMQTLKFPEGPVVLGSLVTLIPSGKLKCFVDESTGEKATGSVGMSIPDDLSVSRSVSDGTQSLTFTLTQQLDNAVTSPCASADILYADKVPPIKSINGVRPDSSGRIAVVFR